MKVFIGSLVIFFGTLLAAALVVLGQPNAIDVVPHVAPSNPPGSSAKSGSDGESRWERLFAVRGLR